MTDIRVSPDQLLKQLEKTSKLYKQMQTMSVDVGLPMGKVPLKMRDGVSIATIGAAHELGLGNNPRRSFLNMPFSIKKKDIEKVIAKQLSLVKAFETSPQKALNIIGSYASGISREAFTTRGFGQWVDIQEETKRRKGSSAILIDDGTLMQSITWEVKK